MSQILLLFLLPHLIQLASATTECGSEFSPRYSIAHDTDDNQITGRAIKEYFGKLIIPIAVYTDRYFEARFKPKGEKWSAETRAKYRDTIKRIIGTTSLVLKNDANLRKVAEMTLKIVHVSSFPIDTIGDIGSHKGLGHGDDIMDEFEEYQHRDTDKADKKWKIAILLVGINAWMKPKEGEQKKKRPTTVTGLASRASFCATGSAAHQSTAWVEAKSMVAGIVAAHEIGHVLGAYHDDDQKAKKICNGDQHVMARSVGPGRVTFSTCSAFHIRSHFQSLSSDCFTDLYDDKARQAAPGYELDGLDDKKTWPGYDYSPDQQCQYAFGKVYTADYAQNEDVCSMTWCKHNFWSVKANPALPGSQCSQQFPELRCDLNGKCVKF